MNRPAPAAAVASSGGSPEAQIPPTPPLPPKIPEADSYPLPQKSLRGCVRVDAAAALAVVLALDGFPFADAGVKDR